MKKYILLISVLSTIFLNTFAQITVEETDGTPLYDGDTRIYHTDGDEADLKLVITNNASKQIELKVRCESIEGASGEGMSFCVYNCYSGISVGKEYPLDPAQFFLDAGESSGTNEVHFHHINLQGDPDVTTYVLKIFEVGNETNNSVQFTYKYDANYSSINDFENQFNVYPNPASGNIYVKNTGAKKLSVKNILGKELFHTSLSGETLRIDLGGFQSGIYFCSFYDENNRIVFVKKLIIK